MSHHGSIVEQIVDKIPAPDRRDFKLSRKLKEQTNEQLRLLETKISVGMLGKGDKLESRAAIILEYLARQGSIHRFSLESLATAVGMKKKLFQVLHRKVANYLPSLSVSIVHTSKTAAKRKAAPTSINPPRKSSTASRSASTASAASDTAEISSSIPSLSIRLGSLVHDSHGFATRAEQLMQDIQRFMSNKKSHLRREALNDLHRHRKVYECCCFYVVATQATTTVQKGRTTSSQALEEGTMAADERQLEEKDVIHASNVSEQEFRDILPTVVELATEVARSKKDPPSMQEQNDEAEPEETSVQDHGAAKETQVEELRHVYSEAFEEWKDELLTEASHEGKQMLSEELGIPMEDITESRALERAADEVLRRHGLLVE